MLPAQHHEVPRTPLLALPPTSDHLDALGVSMRPVGACDLPFLRRLYHSFRTEELALVPWTPARKAWFLDDQFRLQHADWSRRYAGADFLVVERKGAPYQARAPIGRLYLDRTAMVWRIVDIGLTPSARGAGVGAALLEWVQSAARHAGAARVDLQVLLANPRAQALYRRLGFQITGDDGARLAMVWTAPPGVS